jgi:ATP-dependent Clp protease ATP-binding subunit ClpB
MKKKIEQRPEVGKSDVKKPARPRASRRSVPAVAAASSVQSAEASDRRAFGMMLPGNLLSRPRTTASLNRAEESTLAWRNSPESSQRSQQEKYRQESNRMNLTETVVQNPALLDPNRVGRDSAAFDRHMRRMIVGQDEALRQLINAFQMHQTGLCSPGRPIGNLLFLGPTGTGKTRVVEAAADFLHRKAHAPLLKVDCAEFQHSHEIAKLVGSPPGYLGHRETHPLLSQENVNNCVSEHYKVGLVLFDEIEKASDALWNLLLGILDKAVMTTGDNRKVDFSRCLIVMTSNLGVTEMNNLVAPRFGFQRGSAVPESAQEAKELNDKMEKTGVDAARRKFTPEFMNRLDKTIVFESLQPEHLRRILDIELGLVQQRILNAAGGKAFIFTTTPAAKDHLLEIGIDLRYGARHLKRSIERTLVQPISNLIATDQVRLGDWLKVDYTPENGVQFLKQAEGLPLQTMAELLEDSMSGPLLSLANAVAQEQPRTQNARPARRG